MRTEKEITDKISEVRTKAIALVEHFKPTGRVLEPCKGTWPQ